MPSWSLARGATIVTSGPPRAGLVAWFKGDVGLEGSGGLATAWLDQSGRGQDLDQFDATFQPSIGDDDIDGIPALSFPLQADSAKYLYRTQDMVDRFNDPITAGARTIVAMVKPKFSAAAFNITGGPVFTMFQHTQPHWDALFDLEGNFVADGAYGWSSGWRDPGSALQFTPITGGNAGPYNGVATLCQWDSTGHPDISFLLNNNAMTLTPGTQYPGTGPNAAGGFMMGNVGALGFGLNFLGSITEVLVYDYKIREAPSQFAKLITYMIARYPSAPITP